MKSRGLVIAAAVVVFTAAATLAGAQALASGKVTPATGANDIGLIFSASNILMDLESYQAGVGGKIAWEELALRAAFDVGYSGVTQAFSINAGIAVENHFMPGVISPYFGAFAQAGYNVVPEVLSLVPFSVGAIAGIEVFIFDFLSIFAEYALSADFALTTDLLTETSTLDWTIETKMGNNSMIGIVVYFQRAKPKK
jgi:hypothetical protein